MAVGAIILVRIGSEDLNADWLIGTLAVIFYFGLLWLYVQAGALLPFMRQRKKEWMSGILIIVVGILIGCIAALQNGFGVIHVESQWLWLVEFFYCVAAWPILQYLPYPIVWIITPVIPALLMVMGMYQKHKKMDEEIRKHL